jgi:hypothetical protein
MPASSWLNGAARLAMTGLSGAVLLAASGCGDPELGSVKVPKELNRKGPLLYGPTTSTGRPVRLSPVVSPPAPRTKTARR